MHVCVKVHTCSQTRRFTYSRSVRRDATRRRKSRTRRSSRIFAMHEQASRADPSICIRSIVGPDPMVAWRIAIPSAPRANYNVRDGYQVIRLSSLLAPVAPRPDDFCRSVIYVSIRGRIFFRHVDANKIGNVY